MNSNLPEGWKEINISDIAIPRKEKGAAGSKLYIEIGDIDIYSKKYTYKQKTSIRGCKIAKKNDIVISRVRPTRGAISIIIDDKINVSPAFTILQSKSILVSKYLFYALGYNESFLSYLEKQQKGSSYPGCREQDILDFKICVPPIDIQQKIVSILEKAEQMKDLRKKSDELTKDYLNSVFIEMFGDPGENKNKFPVKLFNDLILDTPQNGIYKPSYEYVNGNNGVPILRIDAFYAGKLNNLSKLKRLNCTKNEIDIYGLKNGEIVINRVNSLNYLGKCALIEGLKEDTVFESNMMRIKLRKEIINPIFLVKILCSKYIKSQILIRAKKAVNQASINQQDVKTLDILVPPIELQNKFASIVKEVEQIKELQKNSKEKINNLFNVLMQKAFKGELI